MVVVTAREVALKLLLQEHEAREVSMAVTTEGLVGAPLRWLPLRDRGGNRLTTEAGPRSWYHTAACSLSTSASAWELGKSQTREFLEPLARTSRPWALVPAWRKLLEPRLHSRSPAPSTCR